MIPRAMSWPTCALVMVSFLAVITMTTMAASENRGNNNTMSLHQLYLRQYGNNSPLFDKSSALRAVVILTTQRSGSGWMLRMLESKSPPLDFRNKEPFGLLGHRLHNFNQENEDEFEKQLYQVFGERCDDASALTCGFKIMYNQIPHPTVFFEFAARHNVAVVHLVRQNYLRRLISLHYLRLDHSRSQVTKELAHELGTNWRQEPMQFDGNETLRKLPTMVHEVHTWRERLRVASLHGVEWIEITYEQLSSTDEPDLDDDKHAAGGGGGGGGGTAAGGVSGSRRTCAALLAFIAPDLADHWPAPLNCSLAEEFSDVQQHSEYHCANFFAAPWDQVAEAVLNFRSIDVAHREYIVEQCESGIRNVSTFDDDVLARQRGTQQRHEETTE